MIVRDMTIRQYTDLLRDLANIVTDDDLQTRITNTIAGLDDALDEVRLVAHDFPLRPDLMVRVTLPMDLTVREAERLVGMIRSLAFDDDMEGPA